MSLIVSCKNCVAGGRKNLRSVNSRYAIQVFGCFCRELSFFEGYMTVMSFLKGILLYILFSKGKVDGVSIKRTLVDACAQNIQKCKREAMLHFGAWKLIRLICKWFGQWRHNREIKVEKWPTDRATLLVAMSTTQTNSPWKLMVGSRNTTFLLGPGLFSGAMLVLGRVCLLTLNLKPILSPKSLSVSPAQNKGCGLPLSFNAPHPGFEFQTARCGHHQHICF